MRNKEIDFLRFIGLSLIIFAHVNPPEPFFQIRNFDVPLMVLLSGMSYALSQKKPIEYFVYIKKRLTRLVLPVWTFLTLYFLASYFFNLELDKLTLNTIFSSYALITGIGYLWIIRVFVLVALLAPQISKLNYLVTSNRIYLLLLLSILLLYEMAVIYLNKYDSNIIFHTATLFIYYAIAYGAIFSLGIRISQLKKTEVLLLILLNLFFVISFAIIYYFAYDKVIYTKSYKYPPRLYYLSYGIFCSLISLVIIKIKSVLNFFSSFELFWLFIGQNTLWIYFWHIIFLKIVLKSSKQSLIQNYLLIYTASLAVYFIQYNLINYQINSMEKYPRLKKLLKQLFIG